MFLKCPLRSTFSFSKKCGVKRPLGVALPPLSRGCGDDASPHKSAKAASRGTKCHGVRDERPLQDLRSSRKIAKHLPGIISASQEARSVCLGRNEPRVPWRLCGQHTGNWGRACRVRERSERQSCGGAALFSCEAPFHFQNWGKAPRGCGPARRTPRCFYLLIPSLIKVDVLCLLFLGLRSGKLMGL